MFCRNCAEVLIDTDVTCPKCGFAAGTGMKYCEHCASPIIPGTVVCEICGENIAPVPFQQQAMPYQQPYAQAQQPIPPYAQNQQPIPPYAQNQQPVPPYAQSQQPIPPYAQGQQPIPPYGQAQQPIPGYQPLPNMAYYGAAQKSKNLAGILGLLLGALGVHNFYLGYTTKGVVQLLMTLFSCGVLGVVSEIWGIVEGIMILTGGINKDAQGLPLKD